MRFPRPRCTEMHENTTVFGVFVILLFNKIANRLYAVCYGRYRNEKHFRDIGCDLASLMLECPQFPPSISQPADPPQSTSPREIAGTISSAVAPIAGSRF